VREHTSFAAFDAVVQPDKVPAALIAAKIKRAIAKKTVEIFWGIRFMAGISLTFFMAEKRIGLALP
jgi:hypothetical protein